MLESLVSRQFLPRGDGLVTRCPIELRLNQLKPEGRTFFQKFYVVMTRRLTILETKEWVEFGHDTDIPKKRYPLSKVAKEILEQTNKLAGTNKGIVSVPIKVSVYSASVVPLTVVDLPGIVKVNCYGMVKFSPATSCLHSHNPSRTLLAISPKILRNK